MKVINIKDIKSNIGLEVKINGWIYNKRSSGRIVFLVLRDGTGFLQCVVEEDNVDVNTWNVVNCLSIESSVSLVGILVKHPKNEEIELKTKSILVIGSSKDYPITKKEHGPEFLFENRDLYLRSKTPWAILRIRDQIFRSITNFFYEEGFIRFDSPILQPTSCEDTTQLFEVKYYEEVMYLTQSGQLYLEAGIMSFGKAYDFGPVFRAEKSKTRNHLSEFWMMDAEMAFYDQEMNEDIQEKMVKRIIKDVLDNCELELNILERNTTILERCIKEQFIRIKHKEAKRICKEVLNIQNVVELDDMSTEEEIALGNYFQIPVFIEDYPMAVKSFYMKKYVDMDGVERAKNADLIAPEEGREIIGGSQREDDYEVLKAEIMKRNYPIEKYEWYLNIRKYGSVPHSGFGLGLERMVRWITGVHHIRETIPFPRTTIINKP
ncbi:MAG: asparagine--tRNA ligase [Candidatus Dojkabacteria bacterium]|nr:asparagine--tRNA ligase [Candidatus Dojkabacteria bacterium]